MDCSRRKNQKDKESKFVNAVDKILGPINIFLDNGRSWKEIWPKLTYDMLTENKKLKIQISPEIQKYFNKLKKILEKNKKNLFKSNLDT